MQAIHMTSCRLNPWDSTARSLSYQYMYPLKSRYVESR